MHPGGKTIKVLRWFVLAVLGWLVAFGLFLFTVAFELTEVSLGEESEEVGAGLRYDFEQGEQFSFHVWEPGLHGCVVAPANAEPRSFAVSRFTSRRGGGTYANAWFTGSADIRCEGPVRFKSPAEHAQDELWMNLMLGALAVGSGSLVIGIVQVVRRTRAARQFTPPAAGG